MSTVPVKSPLKSKTIWVSVIVAVAAFFPSVQVAISANPEIVGMVVGGIFAVLRLITKGKVVGE